jgi:hypothetical protein
MRYEQYSPSIIRWNHEYPTHWSCEKAKRFFANPKKLNKENEESNILSLTLRGVIRIMAKSQLVFRRQIIVHIRFLIPASSFSN